MLTVRLSLDLVRLLRAYPATYNTPDSGNPTRLPLGQCLSYGILLSIVAIVPPSVREIPLSFAAEMLLKLVRTSAINILRLPRADDNLLNIATKMCLCSPLYVLY
jgi:hypothetical protein